jgi:ERCC4-related helicase
MFTDDSPDIKKYSFDKVIDKIVVKPNQLMQELRRCILNILKKPVETLATLGVFYEKNPEHISCGKVVVTMQTVMKDKPANLNVCCCVRKL